MQVLHPFSDGSPLWIGEEGYRRKVFRISGQGIRGELIASGLTIFEPGEASSYHSHPDSEEVNFIAKGSGQVKTETGEILEFGEHDFMHMPKGHAHQHINTGDEPLWIVWIYSPQTNLPTD